MTFKVLISAAMLMAIGCRSAPPPPKPLATPSVVVSSDHYLGTALSGPLPGSVATSQPAACLDVQVTVLALERIPAKTFTPLGSVATFFTATGGRNAVLPIEELIRDVQVAMPKSAVDFPGLLRSAGAGRLSLIASLPGSLPPGVTAVFSASDADLLIDPVTASPTHRTLEVTVDRPVDSAGSPRVALVVTDLTKTNPPELRTERALFALSKTDRGAMGFILPFRFDHADSRATAIFVTIAPGSNDAMHVAVTTKCLQQVADHLDQKQLSVSNGQGTQNATLAAAFDGLKYPASRRASLALLANQTSAWLCEDFSLEADDALLAQLTASLTADSTQPAELIGWQLDRAALMLLAKLLDASTNGTTGEKMPEELIAILTTHAGEVGRHPSSLNDVLAGVVSRQDLDNRLIAQNTIYLEDSSPASRVRAYDWLKSHDHEVIGFDPLASATQRQSQLERAFSSPSLSPEPGTQPTTPSASQPTTAPAGVP